MTRTHTAEPVWTWKCDRCSREHYLARAQSGAIGLPTPAEMREQGWHIAEVFGDLCPPCNTAALTRCTCPSGDGSLRWPCPTHPPTTHPTNGGPS